MWQFPASTVHFAELYLQPGQALPISWIFFLHFWQMYNTMPKDSGCPVSKRKGGTHWGSEPADLRVSAWGVPAWRMLWMREKWEVLPGPISVGYLPGSLWASAATSPLHPAIGKQLFLSRSPSSPDQHVATGVFPPQSKRSSAWLCFIWRWSACRLGVGVCWDQGIPSCRRWANMAIALSMRSSSGEKAQGNMGSSSELPCPHLCQGYVWLLPRQRFFGTWLAG